MNIFKATLLLGFILSIAPSEIKAQSMDDKVLQSDEVTFNEIAPFVKMGSAWGNMQEGAHGTFGIFKAGAASPKHVHSGAYHGVVISGVMTNPFGDEKNPPEMEAGSYWYVPAGREHVTACISEEPCLFYFHAESGFDFTPAGDKD